MPSYRLLSGGGLGWGLVMVASMLLYQLHQTGLNSTHLFELGTIYFGGGFLGWISALPVASLVTGRRAIETRFAACFFGLSVATISFTAFLFAMQYRMFYARWHDPFGSLNWAIEFVETGAGAVYQFLVLGLPHYLPLAFPALLVVSFRLASGTR